MRGERESAKGKKCGFAGGGQGKVGLSRFGGVMTWLSQPESCIARILLAGRSLTPTSSLDRVESGRGFERYVKFLLL